MLWRLDSGLDGCRCDAGVLELSAYLCCEPLDAAAALSTGQQRKRLVEGKVEVRGNCCHGYMLSKAPAMRESGRAVCR